MSFATRLDFSSAAIALCAVALFSAGASAQNYPGSGGPIPSSGTGGGTYPSTPLAGTELSSAVAVPSSVTSVDKITLNNWTHTWVGDMQIVLVDPTGVGHNVMVRPGFTGSGFGNSGDRTGGLYEFVPSGGVAVPHAAAAPMPAATYNQDFGNPGGGLWVSGTSIGAMVVNNTPMNTITGPSGNWTLKIFDWASGDVGNIDSWILHVNGSLPAPTPYCTAKVTSNACIPSIGSTGVPSASTGSGFLVNGTQFMNNKNCLLFYGVTGQAAIPFQGGTLCVSAPIKRTPGTNTLGNPPPNDCSGVPSIDMNLFAVGGLGGTPLAALTVAGTVVDCQWWGRDPGFAAPNNTQLSNGLEYTVGP